MRYKFILYTFIVALLFNATISFSQVISETDSLLLVIDKKIVDEEYDSAEALINYIKTIPQYEIDSIKLEVDLTLAKLHQTKNEDEKALGILLNGLSKTKEDKSSPFIADYAYEIGRKFSKIKNFKKGLEYFRMVLSSGKYRNDSLDISRGLIGIGNMHFQSYLNSSFNGMNLEEGIQKSHKDSALIYFKKVIETFPKNESERETLALANNNLLGYYVYDKDYDLAEFYGKKSLEIRQQQGDSIKIAWALNGLGAITTYKGDLLKAKEYYGRALEILDKKVDYSSKKQKLTLLNNIADNYKRRKEYKEAYNYLNIAQNLGNELNIESDNKKYAEYEAKYNVAEKEKLAEIEKNKRQQIEFWLYVLGLAIILLVGFSGLLYNTFRLRRKNLTLEHEQEKLLQERKIEQVQNESQIKILNATLDGKEDERRHIAEVLHNSVSALLSSANLHLQAAKIDLKDKTPEEIIKTQAIISEAADKIRDLSHKLVSSVLLKFGLSYAMEDLCEKYSNSQLTFETQSKNIIRYNQDFEIKIHSIIEEFVNNIIKHSNADKATLLLEQKEGKLQVRVFDDGEGFDIEKMRKNDKGGLGLVQIEARIKMMEGIFDIKSSKDTGTRIYMNIPIPEDN